ncbi:hypothetical protein [Enterococcus gallinarum]|nr:hypothetical protein [Enterococcus gallinarum]MDT2680033.1 hypothetical protein [Enterococcus gallinarum]
MNHEPSSLWIGTRLCVFVGVGIVSFVGLFDSLVGIEGLVDTRETPEEAG